MKTQMLTVAACLLAAPAFAQSSYDLGTLTCAQLMQMDETGMRDVYGRTTVMMRYDEMPETDRTAMEAELGDKLQGVSDRDRQEAIYQAMAEADQARMDQMSEEEKTTQMSMMDSEIEALQAKCEGHDEMLVRDAAMGSKR